MSDNYSSNRRGEGKNDEPQVSQRTWTGRLVATLGRLIAGTWSAFNTAANGVIALLTIVLALTAWWQWQAAEKSLQLTREQVRAGQRAYLTLHGAKLIEPLAIGKIPGVTIELTNNGQTPAINVTSDLSLTISRTGCPTELVIPHNLSGTQTSTIAANRTLKEYAFLLTPPIDGDLLRQITAETFSVTGNIVNVAGVVPRLVFFGRVRYDDVFGGHGETEFSAVYMQQPQYTGFVHCFTHNTMK